MRPIRLFYLFMVILIISLFLVGCSPAGDKIDSNLSNKSTDKAVPESKNYLEKNLSQNINQPSEDSEISPVGCGGWRCISSFVKAYQYENCTFGKSEKCSTSCVNNTCAPAKVCISGFKCSSDKWSGYQLEDCSWTKGKKCEFGCSNGECNPMPEGYNVTNITNITLETPKINEPVTLPKEEIVPTYSLKMGEEHQIGGTTLKVYNMDSEKVILMTNGIKSKWLVLGDGFNVGTSKINITEISFQPYLSGIQMVSYIIQ